MSELHEESIAPPTVVMGDKVMTIAEAEASVRASGSWFWWIAALSLVNSVATMLEIQYGMMLGLGFTRVLDAVLLMPPDGMFVAGVPIVVRAIHLALVLGATGFFYFLGRRARAGSLWAFRVGMLFYFLDGGIFLLISDWIGVGFHAFVLFLLWGGLTMAKALQASRAEPAPVMA